MANRLSSIVTRTGDDGTTGLADGSRLSKDAPRVHAMGEVDELNSLLGLLRSAVRAPGAEHGADLASRLDAHLAEIQNDLFDLGGELAIPGAVAVRESHVAALDGMLAHYNADLPRLQEFILPGGTAAASHAHVARSACRRAERSLVALPANADALRYVNRLSDLLFVLSRVLQRAAGLPEPQWRQLRRA